AFPGWEFLLPLVTPRAASVFDFLDDPIFLADEPIQLESTLAELYDGLAERYSRSIDGGVIALPPDELFLDAERLRGELENFERIELRALGRDAAAADEAIVVESSFEVNTPLFLFPAAAAKHEFDIISRPVERFRGDIRRFADKYTASAEAPRLVMQTQGLAERLEDVLRDYNVTLPKNAVTVGDLSAGFEMPEFGLTVYTETDVFGEAVREEIAGTAAVK